MKQVERAKRLVEKNEDLSEAVKSSLRTVLNGAKALAAKRKPEEIDALAMTLRGQVITWVETNGSNIPSALSDHLTTIGAVAVRSSGIYEDSFKGSRAGVKASFLNVIGLEGERGIYQAVVQVWESKSEGVLIDEMFNPKASGVIFSALPVDRRTDLMRITLAEGLAKGLVDHIVRDPDSYIFEKPLQDETIRRQIRLLDLYIGKKNERVVLNLGEGGGVTTLHQITTPEDTQTSAELKPALKLKKVVEVAELANHLSQYFGFQIDVEFSVLADGSIVVLQLRPITTIEKYIKRGRAYLIPREAEVKKVSSKSRARSELRRSAPAPIKKLQIPVLTDADTPNPLAGVFLETNWNTLIAKTDRRSSMKPVERDLVRRARSRTAELERDLSARLDKIRTLTGESASLENMVEQVSSTDFEDRLRSQLDGFAPGQSLARSSELAGRLRETIERSLVGIAFAEVPSGSLPEISEAVSKLLLNPTVLSSVYEVERGSELRDSTSFGIDAYVLDVAFLPRDGRRAAAEAFLDGLMRSGLRVILTYSLENVSDERLASELVRNRPEILLMGYRSGRLNEMRLRKVGGIQSPLLILPKGISFEFGKEGAWKTSGAVANPHLVSGSAIDFGVFVRLTEFALFSGHLKDQDGGVFPELTEPAFISLLGLLNQLTRADTAQKVLQSAA